MSNTQYYANTHIKSANKYGCIVCGKGTDRLDVVAESYLCSPECDGAFYGTMVVQEMSKAM